MVFAAAGGTRVRNVAKVSVQFWQLRRSTMSDSTTTTAEGGMEGAISQDGNRAEEVVVDDQGRALTGVTEGTATVYFPPDSPEEVFYNPGRVPPRDGHHKTGHMTGSLAP